MALNFAAAIFAMTGILNPVLGALVHNSGSVLVIINSVFLLKWTPSCFFDTPLQTASRNRVY
jgi:cation transport ATPase